MHVGLKHVDDTSAVVGSNLDVLVHVSRGVNDNAPSRLFGSGCEYGSTDFMTGGWNIINRRRHDASGGKIHQVLVRVDSCSFY